MRTTKLRSRVLLALTVMILLAAATIFAVHNDNLFELGTPPYNAGSGNIAGDGNSANGPDWGDIFNSDGTFKDVIGVSGRPDYKAYGGIGGGLDKECLG